MTRYIDSKFFALDLPYRLLITFAVLLVLALFAWKSRQLKLSGLAGALVMGFASIFIAGFSALFLYLFFFLTAAALSLVSKKAGVKEIKQEKGSRRDIFQVLANGLLPLVSLLFYQFTGHRIFLMTFAATLAESAADTWAGEIGRLSRTAPVNIITGKKVEKGTSGGITMLGVAASLFCCVLYGILYYSSFWNSTVRLASLAAVTAFFGSVMDSFLGASAQALYYDPDLDEYSEKKTNKDGKELRLVKGFSFFTNDMVNFCSNLLTFVFALAMSALIA